MNTQKIKEKFIEELEDQIWRKELNIAFDLSKIPEIEKLRDDKFKELDGLNADYNLIDPADTTKQTRVKRKDLEKKIATAEDFTLKCDETIVTVRDNTNKERERIDQLMARIKFARGFILTVPEDVNTAQ
ncbi:hypothetical protein IPJ70_04220 [Candidatus Campbellbacteria bacterium]|nr:MAG: hypothetical protein IPJ70_04220 [Candidatus Campbellbacteria bacterium]